jgi:hypothetical protein
VNSLRVIARRQGRLFEVNHMVRRMSTGGHAVAALAIAMVSLGDNSKKREVTDGCVLAGKRSPLLGFLAF